MQQKRLPACSPRSPALPCASASSPLAPPAWVRSVCTSPGETPCAARALGAPCPCSEVRNSLTRDWMSIGPFEREGAPEIGQVAFDREMQGGASAALDASRRTRRSGRMDKDLATGPNIVEQALERIRQVLVKHPP